MFDSSESASLWFDIFNGVLFTGALLVTVGTWGTIKTAGIKERFSDERIAANEVETRRAIAESDAAKEGTAKANERIAELNNDTERLKSDNIRLQAQLAPRSLSKEQFDEIQTLKGRIAAVNIAVEDDTECNMFAAILGVAIQHAGVVVRKYDLPAGFRGSGLMIYDQHAFENPNGEPTDGEPLSGVLKKAAIPVVGTVTRLPSGFNMPADIPAIYVLGRPSLPFVTQPYFWPPANPDPVPNK